MLTWWTGLRTILAQLDLRIEFVSPVWTDDKAQRQLGNEFEQLGAGTSGLGYLELLLPSGAAGFGLTYLVFPKGSPSASGITALLPVGAEMFRERP